MNTYHGEVYATSDKFSIYASQPANYTTDAGRWRGLLPLALLKDGIVLRASFQPRVVIGFDSNPGLGPVPAVFLNLQFPLASARRRLAASPLRAHSSVLVIWLRILSRWIARSLTSYNC